MKPWKDHNWHYECVHENEHEAEYHIFSRTAYGKIYFGIMSRKNHYFSKHHKVRRLYRWNTSSGFGNGLIFRSLRACLNDFVRENFETPVMGIEHGQRWRQVVDARGVTVIYVNREEVAGRYDGHKAAVVTWSHKWFKTNFKRENENEIRI